MFNANDEYAARLGAAVERWALSDAQPVAETATSWVVRVTSDSRLSALKLLKPYGADEINGARLMQWWAGDGAAAIHAVEGHDILMEWLAGAPLADMIRADHAADTAATEILCDVVARLHRQRPEAAPALTSLDDWFRRLADADLSFLPVDARPLWQRAKSMLEELLASTTERVPLHGDLHHDNVIGDDGGWRVIDPKGLIGDPHYEVGNVFRNPYGASELARRPDRIDRLADQFAGRLGWKARRVLEWASVHSAISALWDRSAGNSFDWDLTMLPLLLAAVDRS